MTDPVPSGWADALHGALPIVPMAQAQVSYFLVSPSGRYVACTTHVLHSVLIDTQARRYARFADWSVRSLTDEGLEMESDETRMQAFSTYADLWLLALADPALPWQPAPP
ncbi:MAG: hypothetical protein EOO33_17080 [Comamonadaceae bacterium]|nr:MAG: hypothetical protein EOO33_17080 [Comamonadaceae bacterium]